MDEARPEVRADGWAAWRTWSPLQPAGLARQAVDGDGVLAARTPRLAIPGRPPVAEREPGASGVGVVAIDAVGARCQLEAGHEGSPGSQMAGEVGDHLRLRPGGNE